MKSELKKACISEGKRYSKNIHYRKGVKRDRSIYTTHGSLIDFSLRDFIAGAELIMNRILSKNEFDISKMADLYGDKYDTNYKEQAATDFYNGYMEAIKDLEQSNIHKIDPYKYATGSINGLPAIPEKHFKSLITEHENTHPNKKPQVNGKPHAVSTC